jgi:hypothetical protein
MRFNSGRSGGRKRKRGNKQCPDTLNKCKRSTTYSLLSLLGTNPDMILSRRCCEEAEAEEDEDEEQSKRRRLLLQKSMCE